MSRETSTSVFAAGRLSHYSLSVLDGPDDFEAERRALASDVAPRRTRNRTRADVASRAGLSADQLVILQSISADVAAALDPIALAEHVVGELHARFGYELPSVYLLQKDGSLRLAAQIGYRQPYLTIPAGTGVIGRVLSTRAAVLVRDVTADHGFRFAEADVVSEVCVPIVGAGQIHGVVNVETRRAGILDERDLILLELLARLMAVALRNAENQRSLTTLLGNLPGMAYRCRNDQDWTSEFVSQGCLELTGYPVEAFLSHELAYGDLIHMEDRARLWEDTQTAVRLGRAFQQVYRIRTASGVDKWVWQQGCGVPGPDGHIIALEGFVSDITERKRAEEALEHQALHDGLTGLPNRLLLQDRLNQAIRLAERDGRALALCVIDLDRFKDVNDTLGHVAGDRLLQKVAWRLRNALRASDTIARLGGDEFAVVLPEADLAAATLAAEKIVEALGAPLLLEGLEVTVGASVGISVFPDNGGDSDTLLRRADLAMYVAKQTRGGFVLYAPEQDRTTAERLTLVGELRRAIANDELTLYYQPKVDCRSGAVAGVEALVRWHHPQHGLIPPDRFIPLAEQTGLIRPLTRWVLNAAVRQTRAWHDEGLLLSVAVNLSAHDLRDAGLPAGVAQLLARWNIGAEWLKLELTESALMADPTQALQVLTDLCALGVRIAIDDFGTGYSFLGYLKRLPAHEIKIDRSFVADMAAQERDQAIVRSTIDLGHNLGLAAVAEGVEDQRTLDLLNGLGCDLAQGYYLSRPLPVELVAQWCRGRSDTLDLLAA